MKNKPTSAVHNLRRDIGIGSTAVWTPRKVSGETRVSWIVGEQTWNSIRYVDDYVTLMRVANAIGYVERTK